MAAATLTFPEAKTQLSTVIREFNALAAAFIAPVSRGEFPPESDTAYLGLIDILRKVDILLDVLCEPPDMPEGDRADTAQVARATRMAAYLALCNAKPDQAWYWAPDHQAHVRHIDRTLTPAMREQVLAEARADYASLTDDERVAIREENRILDGAIADGLDAD